MKICLYGAASSAISKLYITSTELLGKKMALRGHSLVYGGGAEGLMGAAARGVVQNKGKLTGVAPSFFTVDGVLFKQCTDFIYTDTMRSRKQIMEESADAFIMVPGGVGTLDEFFEILTLKQLGRHTKPIAVYNINGYFDKLYDFLESIADKQFMNRQCLKLFAMSDNPDRLLDYLETHIDSSVNTAELRNLKIQ